jgi:hypothetical protein
MATSDIDKKFHIDWHPYYNNAYWNELQFIIIFTSTKPRRVALLEYKC